MLVSERKSRGEVCYPLLTPTPASLFSAGARDGRQLLSRSKLLSAVDVRNGEELSLVKADYGVDFADLGPDEVEITKWD